MAEMRVRGLSELARHLRGISGVNGSIMNRQISNVVRLHGIALNRRMVKNANFVKGYSTGDTRRSIRMELKDGGMTAVVKPSTDYSPYLEYGTRFMAAQPFVRPSFDVESQLFIEDLRKLIE